MQRRAKRRTFASTPATAVALGVYAFSAATPTTDDYRLAIWPNAERSPGFRLQDVDGKQRTLAD